MATAGNRGSAGTEYRPGLQSQEGTLSGMACAVKEKAQDIASTVTSKAENAWDSTKQMGSAVADTAENAWEQATDFMRRYPVATMCVGFGLGFLCARLMEDMRSSSFGRGMRGFYPNYSGGQYESNSGRQNYQS